MGVRADEHASSRRMAISPTVGFHARRSGSALRPAVRPDGMQPQAAATAAGWEQGTCTHHGGPKPAQGTGRWLLIGIGVLVVVIIAAAVVVLLA